MAGECPRCGDIGITGTLCMDCGCADYVPRSHDEIEEEARQKARIEAALDGTSEETDDKDDYPF